jgi:hypothetical protein
MRVPKTIQSLADEAKIREAPSSYSQKIWQQTAMKLMDSADQAYGLGDLANCFSQNLRALRYDIKIIQQY